MVGDPQQGDIMWETAKLKVASNLSKKKKGILSRILSRNKKSCKVDEQNMQIDDIMKKCPLASTTEGVRKMRKGEARKVAVCESQEADRKFVYETLKYYRQYQFVEDVVGPMTQTNTEGGEANPSIVVTMEDSYY